jgi:hypothetical protein
VSVSTEDDQGVAERGGGVVTACGHCIAYGVRTGLPSTGVCPICHRNSNRCRTCGGHVEEIRWIYWTPTCFGCLAPPAPIEVLEMPGGAK